MEIRKEKGYVVNKWAGGITRELFIWPQNSSLSKRNFDVRISSAVINSTESNFSDFSGFMRYIMPLQGSISLELNGEKITLERGKPFQFDGGDKVSSTNTPGAIDFNVIVRKGVDVDFHVTGGDEIQFPEPGQKTVIFALEEVRINSQALHVYETAITEAPFALQGQCAVITVK